MDHLGFFDVVLLNLSSVCTSLGHPKVSSIFVANNCGHPNLLNLGIQVVPYGAKQNRTKDLSKI